MPPPDWSDRELVEALCSGGHRESEAESYLLFELCHDAIWFWSNGSKPDYDDLLGAIYLHLRGDGDEGRGWTALRKWHVGSSLKTWLGMVIRNLHFDRLRKLGRESGHFRQIEEWGDFAAEASLTLPERNVDVIFTRSLVLRAMEKLTDQERLVVHLNFLEERTIPEVAELMKISVGNVGVIKHRAIKALRGILEGAANDHESR